LFQFQAAKVRIIYVKPNKLATYFRTSPAKNGTKLHISFCWTTANTYIIHII